MNNKVAFTGDQHFFHENILRLCDRPFNNIIEHNKALIANHNQIAYDDSWEMWLLGDTSYKCSAQFTVKISEKLTLIVDKFSLPTEAWGKPQHPEMEEKRIH